MLKTKIITNNILTEKIQNNIILRINDMRANLPD